MAKSKSLSEAKTLRRGAEDRLRAKAAELPQSQTVEDTQRLFHELQVHQIELEMQNAELRQARDEIELALEKYTDLYDFAPVGYCTLDRSGTIRAANLTAAGLLGIERAHLIGRVFASFVAEENRLLYADYIATVFKNRGKEVCELGLAIEEGSRYFMRIEGITSQAGNECRIVFIDINKRKLAEQENRLSRERLDWVLDKTRVGMWFNELPLDRLSWDALTKELFFIDQDAEPTIELFWSRLHPDDREPTRLAVENALREHSLYAIDHRAVDPVSGEVRWIHSTGNAAYATDGTPVRFDGINYNISALKRAEEARHAVEELNCKTLQALPAHIAVIDHQGRIIAVNEAWTEFARANHAEGLPSVTVGADYCQVCRLCVTGPDLADAAQALAGIESVLAGVQRTFTMEYPCHSPQQQCWYLMTVVPLGLSGESGAVITHSDISARRLAEEALRESEARFRDVANASADWIWEIDSDYRYTYASGNIMNALGYEPEEILGRTPFDLMPPGEESRIRGEFQAIAKRRDSFRNLPNINLHKNGEIRHILTTGLPIFDSQGHLSGYRGVDIDITERKRAEEKLYQSEKRLALAASATRIGIFDWDLTNSTILWTQTHEAIFGYATATTTTTTTTAATEEHDYRRWADRVHPEDLPFVEEESRRCMQDNLPLDVQYRIIWPDDSLHWVEAKGVFLYASDGKPNRLLGVVMDITEQKNVEVELIARETTIRMAAQKLQTVMDTAPVAICVAYDRECSFITGNSLAHTMLGVPTHENVSVASGSYRAAPYHVFRNGKALAVHELPMQLAASTGTAIREEELEIRRQDGSQITILMSATPLFDANGSTSGSIGTFLDITNRKQTEMAFQASEQRMQQALHVSRSFTFEWQPDTDQVIRSASCESIFNLSGDEAVIDTGNNYFQRIHPDDRAGFVQILSTLSPAANSYTTEYRVVRNDGTEIVLEETGQGTFNANGTLERLVGVTTDITARKTAELELKQAHEQLEQRVRERTADLESAVETIQAEIAERLRVMDDLRKQEQMLLQQSRLAAMGEMINNIAHQWRQPLNTLGLLVQKLPIFYDSTEFNREFLEENTAKCMRLIQHMSQTIDDFRNFFRTDKEKALFCLDTVVRQAVALIEQSFRDLGITIDLHTEQSLKIRGYPNEFAQALLNILMNSRDALVGNKTADARIVVRIFEDGGSPVVTVTDNAGGIPAEIIDSVFDPYFTTKGPDKGTGLGLFMSKTIIEKNMAGRLTVRNTAHGAEFRIEVADDKK